MIPPPNFHEIRPARQPLAGSSIGLSLGFAPASIQAQRIGALSIALPSQQWPCPGSASGRGDQPVATVARHLRLLVPVRDSDRLTVTTPTANSAPGVTLSITVNGW